MTPRKEAPEKRSGNRGEMKGVEVTAGKRGLSIVVVNWNTMERTRQCLQSIEASPQELATEVFVVDNNSSDGSVAMLREQFPTVNLIENRRNVGFAQANNQALTRIETEYALLLNSDTIILADALSAMTEYMGAHGEVGILGCKLRDETGRLQRSAAWFPGLLTVIVGGSVVPGTLSRLLRLKRFPGQSYLDERQHEVEQEVDWVAGACMLVRMSAIRSVGLLDENLFMYGEEIEWCYRIKRGGWSVVYFPGAEVRHFGGGSNKGGAQLPMFRSALAERYIYHKHHGPVASIVYDVVRFWTSLAKLGLWALLLAVVPERGMVRTHLAYHRSVLTRISQMDLDCW